MLTDEELKELEEAVALAYSDDSDKSVIGGAICAEFTRDAIAREKAMRQPLTAEICERLGMYRKPYKDERWLFVMNDDREDVIYNVSDGNGWFLRLRYENPTVGHLFAAAKLAGVELDWRKVVE